MRGRIKRFLRDESGATAIEYGLLAGLMSLVVIGALNNIGAKVNTKFRAVSNGLN